MWEGILIGAIIAFGLAIIALIVSLSLYIGNKIEKAGDKIGERLEVNTNGIIKNLSFKKKALPKKLLYLIYYKKPFLSKRKLYQRNSIPYIR